MKYRRIIFSVCLLSGCAAHPADRGTMQEFTSPAHATQDTYHRYTALVEQLEEELVGLENDALAMTDPMQNCIERVCRLLKQIQDLAMKICTIAQRHPEDQKTQKQCRDANQRTNRMSKKVSKHCSCPVNPHFSQETL